MWDPNTLGSEARSKKDLTGVWPICFGDSAFRKLW
ncbi:hypothetical protein LINPERHAP2_LOCUS33001 [Linum perenne]